MFFVHLLLTSAHSHTKVYTSRQGEKLPIIILEITNVFKIARVFQGTPVYEAETKSVTDRRVVAMCRPALQV